MPPKTHNESRHDRMRDTDRILIERRQIVAEITHDPDSEVTMYTAAFLAASEALADSLREPRSTDSLEFAYLDHRFTINAEPLLTEHAPA